jgi:hypothetical protein
MLQPWSCKTVLKLLVGLYPLEHESPLPILFVSKVKVDMVERFDMDKMMHIVIRVFNFIQSTQLPSNPHSLLSSSMDITYKGVNHHEIESLVSLRESVGKINMLLRLLKGQGLFCNQHCLRKRWDAEDTELLDNHLQELAMYLEDPYQSNLSKNKNVNGGLNNRLETVHL